MFGGAFSAAAFRIAGKRTFLNVFKPIRMVGAVRFELTTSCTRNKRATRLRYAPNQRLAMQIVFLPVTD